MQIKQSNKNTDDMKVRFLQLAFVLVLFSSVSVSATVRCVDLNCTNSTPPYTDWSTAATNIQDAIDAADPGDQILVTDGVFQTGGRVVYDSPTNRVVVDKAVTVQSVNGPTVTVIQGYQVPGTTNGDSAVRCVYLTNGAALIGFTLTNGATRNLSHTGSFYEGSGGGVLCEFATPTAIVSNCVLTGNSAQFGGGAAEGTLINCVLTGNSAGRGGGAAYATLINNCVLTGNSAYGGGGAAEGTLNNCTLTGNSAYFGGGV